MLPSGLPRPNATPYEMAVTYQYLTADECDDLKKAVKNREDEFHWGTLGPDHLDPLLKASIDNLSTGHLENILITQRHLSNELAAAILMLLKKRYDRYGANR